MPDPSSPPKLHIPWHDDMMTIPRARSRLVAQVFMATLMRAAFSPSRNNPMASTAGLGAFRGIQMDTVIPTADQKHVRASPSLATIQPVNGFITNKPAGMANSSKPNSESDKCNLALT